MRDFWPRYLLVAVLGTLAIYYGAPLLRPPPAEPDSATPPWRPPPVWTAPNSQPQRVATVSAPVPTATIQRPLTNVATTPPVATFRPATQDLPTSGAGVTHWGVTIVNAACYALDGARRDEKVAGGTLIEVTGRKSSSRGEMAICRIARPGAGWVGPYLIAAAELVRFPGTREQVDATLVPTLQRYYALNAQMVERRTAMQRAAVDTNPHAEAVRAALAEYEEAKRKAADLTVKRDKAVGGERTRFMDELRAMLAEEERLHHRLTTVNTQYKQWKARNGGGSSALPDDEMLRELQRQMAALRPSLADLGL